MGCCYSTSHGGESPPAEAGSADNAGPVGTATASQSALIPSTAARPNAPLRAPSPLRHPPWPFPNQPWTRQDLQKERRDYFDTRVSGRREVWDALEVVCDLVRQGKLVDAQSIVDAANLTCPSGRVVYERRRGRERMERGGAFDERGVLYEIPPWLVMDPTGIEDAVGEAADGAAEKDFGDEEEEEEDPSGVTQDKGKGRLPDPGEMLVLRARLSNTGVDLPVKMGAKEKVGAVVGRIRDQLGDPGDVRLMYLGRRMETDKTLEQQGWERGHVVNALVLTSEPA